MFVYIEVQPVLTRAALYDHEPVAGISGIKDIIIISHHIIANIVNFNTCNQCPEANENPLWFDTNTFI